MNPVHLVESGKYSKDDLSGEQRACINGMQWMIDEIDTAKANLFEGPDADIDAGSESLQAIVNEIQITAAEKIKDWLYATMCDHIVSYIEANADYKN